MRCWVWISPNGETKNEIDCILTNKHAIFSDLSVLNSINTGSDHRMVWGRAQINTRLERAKLTMQPKKIDTNELNKHQVKFWSRIVEQVQHLWWHPTWWSWCYCRYHTKGHTWNSSPSSRLTSGWKARQVISQDKNAKGEEWWRGVVPLETTLNTFKPASPSGRAWRMTSWLSMRNKSLKLLRKTAWSMPDASSALAKNSSHPSLNRMALWFTTGAT